MDPSSLSEIPAPVFALGWFLGALLGVLVSERVGMSPGAGAIIGMVTGPLFLWPVILVWWLATARTCPTCRRRSARTVAACPRCRTPLAAGEARG